MQVCKHCGQEARDDELVCRQCGQRLEKPAVTVAQAAADAPKGWIWPWQRAGQGEENGHAAAVPAVEVTVRTEPVSTPTSTTPTSTTPASTTPTSTTPASTTPTSTTPSPSAAGRLHVSSVDAMGPARDILLDGRNVTIGRAPACTVSLPDDQLASRLHAMLHFTGEHFTISDLGSSNGTLVNGAPIRGATTLAEGDRITVGQHILTFSRDPGIQPALASEASVPMSTAEPVVEPLPVTIPLGASAGAPAESPNAYEPSSRGSEPLAPVPDDGAPPAHTVADEPEPALSPAPSWQLATADPWVMPAPPQWAAGPGSDVWTAPAPPDAEPAAPLAVDSGQPLDERASIEAAAPHVTAWSSPEDTREGSANTISDEAFGWSVAGAPAPQPASQPDAVHSAAFADDEDDEDQGPATGELDALRTQLVRSTDLLSRWTQSTAAHTRQLRSELAALADELASVLASAPANDVASLDELVRLADGAAQDPHHVNTVVALASRSRDVAQALRSQRAVVAALVRVHDRLAELARQDA